MRGKLQIIMAILVALAAASVASAAETRYVSDDLEVTLRTGPSTEYKIIAMLHSGQKLELVTPGEEWSQVTAPNGKQGWLLTRYLSAKMPPSLALEDLRQKHADTASQNEQLKQAMASMKEQDQQLSAELNRTRTDLSNLTAAHETLKKDSADYLKLKGEYEKAVKDLTEARAKADQAESRLNKLTNTEFNKGLLYGGGLIVFGFFAGFILKRPKRKGPLM